MSNLICGLALVFAIDVSSSVNEPEYLLQKEGIAKAMLEPVVLRAINQQPKGTIAVSVIEWASASHITVPWTIIDGPKAAKEFSDALLSTKRTSWSNTAIGLAIKDAIDYLDEVPCEAQEKKIDVSGDGINNEGSDPYSFIELLEEKNIVVNGLPILETDATEEGFEAMNNSNTILVEHYQMQVIYGPGSFIVPAQGFGDFARAMKQKLSRELVMK